MLKIEGNNIISMNFFLLATRWCNCSVMINLSDRFILKEHYGFSLYACLDKPQYQTPKKTYKTVLNSIANLSRE